MKSFIIFTVLVVWVNSVRSETVIDVSGNQTVVVGDKNVTLQCKVKGLDVFSQVVSWLKMRPDIYSVVYLTSHTTVTSNPNHYSVLAYRDTDSGTITYDLTIRDIVSSDAGFYYCTVTQSENVVARSENVKITVNE